MTVNQTAVVGLWSFFWRFFFPLAQSTQSGQFQVGPFRATAGPCSVDNVLNLHIGAYIAGPGLGFAWACELSFFSFLSLLHTLPPSLSSWTKLATSGVVI